MISEIVYDDPAKGKTLVRWTEVEFAFKETSMTSRLILVVGQDPVVLSTRSSILRSAGYIVRSASSVAESINLFQDADFDMLLLCHSISVQDRDRLTRVIRSTGSRIPIYSIAPASKDSQAGVADGILSSKPENLINELGAVLGVSSWSTAQAGCHSPEHRMRIQSPREINQR